MTRALNLVLSSYWRHALLHRAAYDNRSVPMATSVLCCALAQRCDLSLMLTSRSCPPTHLLSYTLAVMNTGPRAHVHPRAPTCKQLPISLWPRRAEQRKPCRKRRRPRCSNANKKRPRRCVRHCVRESVWACCRKWGACDRIRTNELRQSSES